MHLRKMCQALKVMSELSRYLKVHNIYFEESWEKDMLIGKTNTEESLRLVDTEVLARGDKE